MTGRPSTDGPTTDLGKQAAEIIDSETGWAELGANLDVSRLQRRDGLPESHASTTPFRRMFLAYLQAMVEGESLTGSPDRLADNPEVAEAFGFDPDDLPSESTFKPVRLHDRFEALEPTVKLAAEEIQTIAAEAGSPIGLTIGNDTNEDGDPEPSKRTRQRLLRKESKNVLEEIKTTAIPALDLPRPEKAIYDANELLVLAAIASIKQDAANDAGESLGDLKNPDPDIQEPFDREGTPEGDPFYADGPTGQVLLDAVKELSVDEIADVMNYALRKLYTRAKPRLQELENDNGHRFGTRAKIALDITYVAYWGDRDEMKWVQGIGDMDDKGYDWCHKFATAVIVGENTHFVVGVQPLGSVEYADTDEYVGEDRSYYVGDVARKLVSIANQYVSIRVVYADREFHAADVVYALEDRDLKYVIPAKKNDRIQPECDRFDRKKKGYHTERDRPLYVDEDISMHGPVKHDVSNKEVKSNLVILPPDEEDDVNDEGEPQPFLTNFDVSDEIALDRRRATEKIEEYSDRGAIENSYTSIKEAAAWTTSKEFEVRWFHFAFGCITYNAWLLVDFLAQDRIGVIETQTEPRISLSRFLKFLEDALITLV